MLLFNLLGASNYYSPFLPLRNTHQHQTPNPKPKPKPKPNLYTIIMASKRVSDLIARHAVMVFSKSYCPYVPKLWRLPSVVHRYSPIQPNPTQSNPTQCNPTQSNPTQPNPIASYCVRVKNLFSSLNVKFHALELDQDPEGDAVQSALASLSGQRTVPNVYIGGKVCIAASHHRHCYSIRRLTVNGRL
jgi:glutaredoxin